MLKLLIVDDEFLVRHGIRRIINWDEMDITIVGDAETVPDAINKILKLKPDIVLCDILIPGGDGFDVIKAVNPVMPETEFIILSGYSDREYMLGAIRSEVCDYLLKPANSDEIKRAVLKAREKIINRRNSELRMLEHDSIVFENLDVLRNHFIEDLLDNKLNPQKSRENLSLYQVDLSGPNYVIMITCSMKDKTYNLIQDFAFIFNKFKPVAAVLPSFDNSVAVILNTSERSDSQIIGHCHKDFMMKSENIGSAIIVSPICLSISDLSSHFCALRKLHAKSIWFKKGSFVFSNNQCLPEYSEEKVSELCNKIFNSAKSHSKSSDLIKHFDEFIEYMQYFKQDNLLFYDQVNYIFGTLRFIFNMSYGFSAQDHDISEIRKSFSEFCILSEHPEIKYKVGIAGKAIQYLASHYDVDISLGSVAAELYISPSYLSKIIKEKTNKNFQDWLHYFRMEKAIKLLNETDETANHIAELCGYNSYKLFSEHFKRYTGMTFSEYRTSHDIKT